MERWAVKAPEAAERGDATGCGHRRAISGEVVWRRVCGCYSDSRVRGLTEECRGKPLDTRGGGRAGQLWYLRNNKHPRTRKPLPPPVDERGQALGGEHVYSKLVRREVNVAHSASSSCSPPDVGVIATDVNGTVRTQVAARIEPKGKSAAQKFQDMLVRVRAREHEAKKASRPTLRRLRGKQLPGPEWVL